MAYDAQLGGWYLLHPERDGQPPGGAAGSVLHTSGGSVLDAASAAAKSVLKEVAPNAAATIRDARKVADGITSDVNQDTEDDNKQNVSAVQNGKATNIDPRKVIPLSQDAGELYKAQDEQVIYNLITSRCHVAVDSSTAR